MKALNKLISTFFLFAILMVSAQSRPAVPAPGEETSRGIVGPGAPASPIDMYILALGIIAVMLIVFFTKKYANKHI
ncbi:hypothetical protein ASG22_17025 [Chryseobacterium sp. Leaf405]|uniref:hypothetical protein n=1 Tax=Chryseobacterium sp. Leaf405 TaxID=1736367 RepID=UPI0006FAC592|nr:hypothetical protein [Chryseobacterium sp. Leaf405]KQT20677.1 hypothetical protein ASG22_17025 [Chryseobacterium sp. Leaf405]